MFGFTKRPLILGSLYCWPSFLRVPSSRRPDPESRQGARHAQLRRQPGVAGVLQHGRRERVTGFDVDICRAVAAAIFWRSRQGDVRAARRGGSLRGAAVEPDRSIVAQFDMDDVAGKFARLMFAGVAYYDARAFCCAGCRNRYRLAAWRQNGLHSDRHTSELNLSDYFRANDMALKVLRSAPRKRAGRPMTIANATC